MNVAFVTKEKELLMPCFDKILGGCTAKRVAVLAANLVKEGKLRGIRVENVSVEDGKRADEMMLIGSGVHVRSVVQWDEEVIGNGKPYSASIRHNIELCTVAPLFHLVWFLMLLKL